MPSDTTDIEAELLSASYDYLIIQGLDKLYIYDTSAKMLLQSIIFPKANIFLGVHNESDQTLLLFLDKASSSLVFIDLNQNEIKKINLENENWMGGWFDKRYNYLFLYKSNLLRIYSLKNFIIKKLCSYEILDLPKVWETMRIMYLSIIRV